MLEDIKVGDRVVNDLGEEATVVGFEESSRGNVGLVFNRDITGWINEPQSRSWYYTKEGKFVRDWDDQSVSNLVKVLRHD